MDVETATETETETVGLLDFVCIVVRTIVSLAVLVVAAHVMFFAFFFESVWCDDGCADETGDSLYSVQLVLATVVSASAFTAVMLGYGRRSAVYYGAATGAGLGFVAWLALILKLI